MQLFWYECLLMRDKAIFGKHQYTFEGPLASHWLNSVLNQEIQPITTAARNDKKGTWDNFLVLPVFGG